MGAKIPSRSPTASGRVAPRLGGGQGVGGVQGAGKGPQGAGNSVQSPEMRVGGEGHFSSESGALPRAEGRLLRAQAKASGGSRHVGPGSQRAPSLLWEPCRQGG